MQRNKKKITVLHLSDLHRDPTSPLKNANLLQSLITDAGRYTRELSRPDLAIISGDIIYGAKTAGGALQEIASQYEEAGKFLVDLAKEFFNGNRGKIVLVPGNHDVNWVNSKAAMAPLELDKSSNDANEQKLALVRELLMDENTNCRVSRQTLEFFKIVDFNEYKLRFEAFSEFYKEFYEGNRTFSLEPDSQYNIFDFPEFGVVIVGFNSCHNNDHCNVEGRINYACVAAATQELRDVKYKGLTRIGVWHHDTKGPPRRFDYMDSAVLQNLIDAGFTIGFHGHQHRDEVAEVTFHLGKLKKFTVLSAGTLCAGPRDLPSGYKRKYNIIELDLENLKATANVREMKNSIFEAPIWGAGEITQFGAMSCEIELEQQWFNDFAVNDRNADILKAISEAEELITVKDFTGALGLLERLDKTHAHVRIFLLECYFELDLDEDLVNAFYPPESIKEACYLMDSLWKTKNVEKLRALVRMSIVSDSLDTHVCELKKKYEARISNGT